MMSPNSSALIRRPRARTVYVNWRPAGAGSPPIVPAGFTTFCAEMAFTRSVTVSPMFAIVSGATHTRMA